ncbi:MAG: restriction endonuclease [Ardenticatenales bacterium]|jgi:restriction system protein|nr:restriction endonuclease [Ardenticatenales bacterium]
MAVPEFYYFLRPALEATATKDGIHWTEVADVAADRLHLSPDDRSEMIPGGTRSRWHDRTHWALTYLRAAKLVEKAGRGLSRITPRGRDYLLRAPAIIKPQDLREFQEFVDFHRRDRASEPKALQAGAELEIKTPQEALRDAYVQLRSALADEVLDRVKAVTPARFETIIVQLMLQLGYGGSFEDAGMSVGRSGDEGIDGIIKQDRLGLDNIYLQAKRWGESTVGRKEIQAFVGALSGRGASKGVFITTSTFSREARDYAKALQTPTLSLIDGIELARLMINVDLGVSLEERFDVKRIDSDFFIES